MADMGWKTFVCVWVMVQFLISSSESSSSSESLRARGNGHHVLDMHMDMEEPCTCLNEQGSPVDWFLVYKAPSVAHKDAVAPFLYMDSDSVKFRMSSVLVDDGATPFARTLKNSLYGKRAVERNLAYLMYNDEVPPHATANGSSVLLEQRSGHSSRGFTTRSAELLRLHGHTKGVLASDSKTGFWLTHSVPKFPPRAADAYEYPGTAMRYAQHILCLSLSVESVNLVAKQLELNYPQIYDSHIPEELLAKLPGLQTLAKKKPVDDSDHFRVATLSTLDGEVLTNFAKNDVFNASLYRDLLAPHLHSNLRVETWQNGKGGKLGPECGVKLQYQVENVAAIDFGERTFDGERIRFPSTKDHAKWAVATPPRDTRGRLDGDGDALSAQKGKGGEKPTIRVGSQGGPWQPWACIGDVNRMTSQFARGGGTTCFSNARIWQQLSSLIAEVDSCDHDRVEA